MIKQKEHKKDTLMAWTKSDLVQYIMTLEHNIKSLDETIDNQYNSFIKLFNEAYKVKSSYEAAKNIVNSDIDGLEPVHCKDCAYLMFSDCYGECSKAYKGIVQPNDSCGKGVRAHNKTESNCNKVI